MQPMRCYDRKVSSSPAADDAVLPAMGELSGRRGRAGAGLRWSTSLVSRRLGMAPRAAMTREQGFDLQQWIADKGFPYTPCVCGNSELEVSEKFYGAIAITAEGNASLGDGIETMPMAAVVCTTSARESSSSISTSSASPRYSGRFHRRRRRGCRPGTAGVLRGDGERVHGAGCQRTDHARSDRRSERARCLPRPTRHTASRHSR